MRFCKKLTLAIFVGYFLITIFTPNINFPKSTNDRTFRFPNLISSISEDGFYPMTVGWNFSAYGKFIYNGNIETAGVQPLSVFIYAAVAAIIQKCNGDKILFIRSILLLGLVYYFIFLILIRRLIADLYSPPPGIFLFEIADVLLLSNPFLFKMFTNGLETGLYFDMILLVMISSLRFTKAQQQSYFNKLSFGLLLGLACLCRIDFIIPMVTFLGIVMMKQRGRLKDYAVPIALMAAIVLPWFLWVYHVSGSLMPSSGRAQMADLTSTYYHKIDDRCIRMISVLANHCTLWVANTYLPWANAALIILCVVVGLLFLKTRNNKIKMNACHKTTFAIWFFCFLSLAVIYPLLLKAVFFYSRYTAPLLIFVLIIISVRLSIYLQTHSKLRGLLIIFPLHFILMCLLLLKSPDSLYAVAAGFIKNEFFQDARIGCWQSGTVGFFNDNVINLDGKVNSETISYLKSKQMDLYLDKKNIQILFDFPLNFNAFSSNSYLRDNWRICEKTIPEYWCYQRKNRLNSMPRSGVNTSVNGFPPEHSQGDAL